MNIIKEFLLLFIIFGDFWEMLLVCINLFQFLFLDSFFCGCFCDEIKIGCEGDWFRVCL